MISIGENRIAKIFLNGEEIQASFRNEEEMLKYLFLETGELLLQYNDPHIYNVGVEANDKWETNTQ